MNVSRPLLAACLILAAAAPLPAQQTDSPSTPTQKDFEKVFGGKDVIDMIRNAKRVEAVRVEYDHSKPPKLIQNGAPFDVPDKDADLVKSLLTDRNSYLDGGDLCIFDPGVKLIFHDADGGDVTLLICLHCGDVAVIRDDKQVGFANFYFAHEKMLALAADIFPKDKDIRALIDERAARIKEDEKNTARWLSGMPESVKPLWDKAMQNELSPDLKPLRAALAKEFPDQSKRILALLTWYGSGAGPWSGYPAYEDAAENMLLDYSTADIVATIQANPLSDRQLEGAARLFGGWTFSQKRPDDLKTLPSALKKTLLKHSLKSTDDDKVGRAKNAFEP